MPKTIDSSEVVQPDYVQILRFFVTRIRTETELPDAFCVSLLETARYVQMTDPVAYDKIIEEAGQ